MATDYSLNIRPIRFLMEVRHAYTHFTLTEFAWQCELVEITEQPSLKWIPLGEIGNYPMGKVDRAISLKISSAPVSN